MRTLATLVILVGMVVPGLHGQQRSVSIKFTFDADPRATTQNPAEVGNVLTLRSALRAWTDSVDVFLDQVAMGARDKGWLRARQDERANYSVTVTALPVLTATGAASMTIYSIVIFKPAVGRWEYMQNYVGYSTGAQQAAEGIFRAAVEGINNARR